MIQKILFIFVSHPLANFVPLDQLIVDALPADASPDHRTSGTQPDITVLAVRPAH
jgi:hypothetical protein